jgi:hypothetical protein
LFEDFDPEEVRDKHSESSGSEDSNDDLAGTEHYSPVGYVIPVSDVCDFFNSAIEKASSENPKKLLWVLSTQDHG